MNVTKRKITLEMKLILITIKLLINLLIKNVRDVMC